MHAFALSYNKDDGFPASLYTSPISGTYCDIFSTGWWVLSNVAPVACPWACTFKHSFFTVDLPNPWLCYIRKHPGLAAAWLP